MAVSQAEIVAAMSEPAFYHPAPQEVERRETHASTVFLAGDRAYKVNGKALRVRQTFVLEDTSGDEVARIQERKLSVRDKIAIERDGHPGATVHKALVGIRDRFAIDVDGGASMKAHGNVVDHEYEIERDGETVATISKKWFRVRETYGVDVAAGEDTPLILAITVAIDSLSSRAG